MAARVSDHVWTCEEIAALLDRARSTVYPDDVPRAVGHLLYRRSQEVREQLHVRQGIDWEPAQE